MKVILSERQLEVLMLNEQSSNCENDFIKKLQRIVRKIFRPVIDGILEPHQQRWNGDEKKYREVLKMIGIDDDKASEILDINFVYHPDGSWSRINKLNTNYSDLSVLVSDILKDKGEDLCSLLDRLNKGDDQFLLDLAEEMKQNPDKYFDEYLMSREDRYIQNNTRNTALGDESEQKVINFLTGGPKWELIYQAVEGSPIDTKLGIDLIMKNKFGQIKKIQVKSVGSISPLSQTPCEEKGTFTTKTKPGGYFVFSRNGIHLRSENIDYVAYVSGNRIIVCKKYMPVTVINNKCTDTPSNAFPSNPRGSFVVDHESIILKNF